ncbi:MAG: HK97 gp10 family phage protein [Firmicutes bacterium]|nr:HK97 gp10 family phage protein [Bacillota bacterium]
MAEESGLKGLDRVLKQLDAIEEALTGEIMEKALVQGAKVLQRQAKENVKNNSSNTGELYNSIDIKITDIDGEKAAIVYSNKPQAFYTEFGTGPVGEKNKPSNLPPEVAGSLVYHQGGWGFKANNLTESEAKRYGFTHTHKYNGEDYYFTMGQKPHPWLYPAVAETGERVQKTVAAAIRKGIREALRK